MIARAAVNYRAPWGVEDLIEPNVTAVIGTVDGLIAVGYVPEGKVFIGQFRKYRLRIARIALGVIDGSDVIIDQGQGTLFNKGALAGSRGYRIEGEPLLEVGKRYLLFLKQYKTMRGMEGIIDARGKIRAADGSIVGDQDEYLVNMPRFGVFQIKDGKVAMPDDPDIPPLHPTTFRHGPQLLGATEDEAVRIVEFGRQVYEERLNRAHGGTPPPAR